jgi:hypothetical protein
MSNNSALKIPSFFLLFAVDKETMFQKSLIIVINTLILIFWLWERFTLCDWNHIFIFYSFIKCHKSSIVRVFHWHKYVIIKLNIILLLRRRTRENREATEHKHGNVSGADWSDRVDRLTMAGIKFELLSSNCRSEVSLERIFFTITHSSFLGHSCLLRLIHRRIQ